MKMIIKITLSFFLVITKTLSAQEAGQKNILSYADSLAEKVLEYEGLHTVYNGLKPISTVQYIDFEIDSVTTEFKTPDLVKEKMEIIDKSLSLLENDQIGYILLPFKSIYGTSRTYEILVYNKKSIEKLIERKSGFFLKRGIIPAYSPEKLLAIYEFESKFDRFRAYGYLFGYPDHAVDFFVESSKKYQEEGDFVERDFYQLPVASGEDGKFVYAIPKGHKPNSVDLKIKQQATQNVEEYLELKKALNFDGSEYPFLNLLLSINYRNK